MLVFHWLAVAASCLFLCGCGASSPAWSEPTSDPSAASTRSACDDLLARYRATLAGRDDVCAADADCAIYGGIDPDDVCGGAAGVETARALSAISEEMNAAGCPRPGYSCPPIPLRCANGSCR